MSTTIDTLLNAVSAAGAGTAVNLAAEPRYQGGQHTIEVSGTFVGTVDFEGLIDATWYSLWSTTVPAMQTVAGAFSQIRGNVTAYTSGAITMKSRYPLLQDLKTDIDTLLLRLTAARAGYLDELAAANMPTDIDTLLLRLTAARAGYLDELAAANMPTDIAAILAGLGLTSSSDQVIGIQKQIRKLGGLV